MVGIDYTKPGAQTFIDSWAGQFAGWGIDYLKIDGVGTWDQQDVRAWSGRPAPHRPAHPPGAVEQPRHQQRGHLEETLQRLAHRRRHRVLLRSGRQQLPLTTRASVASRFDQVAAWAPYGGPGGYNDYDSLEIGNGANNGLTPDEREDA
ncbi:hypothetical protein ACRAWF_13055 [Streptomyces sp. L7]